MHEDMRIHAREDESMPTDAEIMAQYINNKEEGCLRLT